MKSKLNQLNIKHLTIAASLFIITITSCKKDKLEVKELREYREVGHVPTNAYDGGWGLNLQPDGVADVNPGGDILYRGTYKITGSKINVKTPQNSGVYTFEIISESQIREKSTEAILGLR